MNLIFAPLQLKDAAAILSWQYSPPYDCCNFDGCNREQTLNDFTHPDNIFFAIFGSHKELEGFCSFGPDGQVPGGDYSQPALDIGMGLRPDLTGKGLGQQYAESVIEFGVGRFGASQLRVTIAAFNQRAQTVWQRLRFSSVDRFTKTSSREDYVLMTRIQRW
ncbi:MAG: GNAT family N-acetyltransferase [Cyanobacteria bacterium J06629_9]